MKRHCSGKQELQFLKQAFPFPKFECNSQSGNSDFAVNEGKRFLESRRPRSAEAQIKEGIAFRKSMEVDFTTGRIPASATLLYFRLILEKHKTGEKLFADVRGKHGDAV